MPNVLLIHSDQHRFDMVGAHGNPVVRTPALDALAAHGASFVNAFSTCPICTPARASLMTGAWPTTHGSLCIPSSDFYRPARRELPVLTELLHEAGVFCAMVGKYHGELEGSPLDHGVDVFESQANTHQRMTVRGHGGRDTTGGLFGAVNRTVPAHETSLALQADRTIELIRNAAARGDGFFIRWDPPEPHLPWRPSPQFHEAYRDRPLPAWPSFPDPLIDKPPELQRQHRIWGTDGWSWEDWEPYVRLCYAVVSELDSHVGRVLDALERSGVAQDTLVIYSTDHGDYAGGHGLMDKHFSMYDDIVHVPLILRHPARIPAGARPVGFVSQEIDIARTILGEFDLAAPESFSGIGLVEATTGGAARTDIFSQYFGTESGMFSSRMIRSREWKYVWNPTSVDELYHLESDPGELRNLVADERHSAVLGTLRGRLVEWMESVGDRLCNVWTKTELLGAPNAFERSKAGRLFD